jgi:phosphatidylglycerophosphate synthase
MKTKLIRNSSHLITLARVIMIFIAVGLLSSRSVTVRMAGALTLFPAFLLDGVDGFLARRFNTANNVGSLIDTLGDRITENVLLIFFACRQLIPMFVPLVFLSRSFIADFIRFLAFKEGIGTFSINKSKFGFYIVGSKTSRVAYLLLKFMIFLSGAAVIADPRGEIVSKLSLPAFVFYGAIFLTAVNILRFFGLLFDSREILREAFY